jgi:hypothetical protein
MVASLTKVRNICKGWVICENKISSILDPQDWEYLWGFVYNFLKTLKNMKFLDEM